MWYVILAILFGLLGLLFFYPRKKKDIENKHVVITGGSSGIGRCFAILAAKKGAHVTIIARNLSKLNEALTEIKSHKVNPHQKIQAVSCDVSNYENVQVIINEIEANTGPVYMLVNCAGLAICGVLEDMTVNDINTLLDVNYLGTLYPTKVLVPKMKERKAGIIVITSSQGGLFGIYGYGVYASTKFAVRGLAEALHMELNPYNISVTLSLPPDTDTPGLETENKSKPMETQLISESGGLFKPEAVAEKLLNDALSEKFYSYIGFESFILTNLCAGMTPLSSIFETIIQFAFMGLLRVVSLFYLHNFHGIIRRSLRKKNKIL